MQIEYRTRQLEKVCTDARLASLLYGPVMAGKIQLRIKQLAMASSLGELLCHRIGRCHALSGDRAGQYAMDLSHPRRLVFKARGNFLQVAEIQEIVDYH